MLWVKGILLVTSGQESSWSLNLSVLLDRFDLSLGVRMYFLYYVGSPYSKSNFWLHMVILRIDWDSYLSNLMNTMAEAYYAANPALPNSPEVSAVKKQSSLSSVSWTF